MPELLRTPFDDLDPVATLTTAQIAVRLQVDARSVRRAIERGDLPASRACGLRVVAADAADWWRARAVTRAEPARERERRGVRPARPEPRVAAKRDRLPLPPRGRRAR